MDGPCRRTTSRRIFAACFAIILSGSSARVGPLALRCRTRRLFDERGYVSRGLCLDAGFLKEAEVAKPIDESDLPCSEGHSVSVGQASCHSGTLRKLLA